MIGTLKSLRPTIGVFGRRNVGKSSLVNALIGQDVSIVSAIAGTTTDPVEKAMELAPLGPVTFVDTAGVDDEGELGTLRMARTTAALERCDAAMVVVDEAGLGADEEILFAALRSHETPFFVVFGKADLAPPRDADRDRLARDGIAAVAVSAVRGEGLAALREALLAVIPDEGFETPHLLGDLIRPGGLVVLVVPIDLGAPKGRLILPQVMAIRDILDADATSVVVKERELRDTLARLGRKPDLVVCDSQVVLKAAADTPDDVPLTTFSILMARFKGDLVAFAAGAAAIDRLRPGARVLVAEACSHHALADDIGRVKIPRWLRQYAGGDLVFETVAGRDFPADLSPYALIVQCGGCMVNRKQVLLRQRRAAEQGVAMTNYGVTISRVQGVLPRALACFPAARAAFEAAAAE
ncbi:[FeFe] hydrogenase H-cluster maturation GTPase HydF [Siculibacillus lacustris]|uniref:[FeFe] hydrogenase H-cluster maturation GTPase HydF n=1 Tax=Siculibacillus lacustris TaxID=1549641 RepID=A0A4Q9VN16_9HYPH|nr:[FeFe] hydrogenase H-cluster maturation GTPase HydF [Siculibacillus lacustris]TBW36086.1 [FeFe] hydrogenase H-cluster maturation GTPase HydF [Siculibacillus lacustris]